MSIPNMAMPSALFCARMVLLLVSSTSSMSAGTEARPRGLTVAAISPWDNPNQSPPLPASTPTSTAVKKKKKVKTVVPARPQARGTPPPGDAVRGEGEDGEATAPPPPSPRTRARRAAPAEAAGGEDSEETTEERAEEPSPRPKARTARGKRAHEEADSGDADDEEEDDEEKPDRPMDAMPVILPRLVSVRVGPAMAGRNFHFNGSVNPPLQSENSFPRLGVAVELETFPLLILRRGFLRYLGANVLYERDTGQAAVPQPDGSTNSFPVVQSRFQLDLRYPFQLGDSVIVAPAVGYATTSFDLKRNTPVPPSMCPRGSAEACIPDVAVSHLLVDVNLRLALTRALGLSLVVGYLRGTGVRHNITSESRATATGYHGDLGALYLLNDWLGVGGKLSYWSNAYSFANTSFGYTGASEVYYGGTVGLCAFTE